MGMGDKQLKFYSEYCYVPCGGGGLLSITKLLQERPVILQGEGK